MFMKISGNLHKMKTELVQGTAQYYLILNSHTVNMNACIGKEITFEHSGNINCIKCGVQVKKTFAQGFCYPCFSTAPETEECVLKPELCRAHEGIARDMTYAESHCLISQYVYLAQTGTVKVGVTRSTQIPTRWIDQGAERAMIIAQTPNRHLAGVIEVALKKHVNDKTNWRTMLSKSNTNEQDLLQVYSKIATILPESLRQYLVPEQTMHTINFPGVESQTPVRSYNFDKTPIVKGVLTGIKGQYLIFEQGYVINIRKFGGYFVSFSCM